MASLDCPAVTRVRRGVPPRGPGEEASGRRAGSGSQCQRNHCVRDQEPDPDRHQTLPVEGNRLHLHRGKEKTGVQRTLRARVKCVMTCACLPATQADHRVRRAQREEAHFCNGELQDSTVPLEPLLGTAQVSQRDDVKAAQPHPDTRWMPALNH